MFYLLDGPGAGLFYIFIGAAILFIVLDILLEAVIMYLMKYNSFKKAFWQSLIINIASLVMGFILIEIDWELFDVNTLKGILFLFVGTLIVEGVILYLLNKKSMIQKTLLITLVINIITCGIFSLIMLN